MKISMIGTGYVGLVSGTCFSDRGNSVLCIDKNPQVIDKLKRGEMPFYEPGLEEIVRRNVISGNLRFGSDIEEVRDSNLIFLAVGTPSADDGSFQLDYLKQAAEDVGRVLNKSKGYKVIIGKSTVPQGTYKILTDILNREIRNSGVSWDYVSNPETLAEGSAVRDFSRPDRILIGTNSDKAYELMVELYHPFVRAEDSIMRGSIADAELAKLFANTILASRVAAVNEFSRIVDVTGGADMENIRKMVGSDDRIGSKYFYPGAGYGGSCFPKDIRGLVEQSKLDGYIPHLLERIHKSNEMHKKYCGERVIRLLGKENPTIAVWGVTFKPNTDDMRDAPSIPIINHFLKSGASVNVYDPKSEKAREVFGERVNFSESQYGATEGADALVLITEWAEFDALDYNLLKKNMVGGNLFDLRNRWMPESVNRNGFSYIGVGRNYYLSEIPF